MTDFVSTPCYLGTRLTFKSPPRAPSFVSIGRGRRAVAPPFLTSMPKDDTVTVAKHDHHDLPSTQRRVRNTVLRVDFGKVPRFLNALTCYVTRIQETPRIN